MPGNVPVGEKIEFPLQQRAIIVGQDSGAAGALECLVSVLATREGLLPASAHLGTPDPRCALNHVGEAARPSRIRHALSFSCGFGGTNAALVIAHPGTSTH